MSLINITDLTFSYDGSYDNIFENVAFQIDTDWKLGFIGRNGRGKTTFLNLLLGKYEYRGSISKSVQFDYFPYEVADKSMMTLHIAEEISADMQQWELQKELARLEVDDEVLYRPFDTLSNGEQTKVLLASLFLNDHHFLLIDEPTNHLDVHAREVVGAYLNSKKGFILVSHDRGFLDSCIDHVLSINKNTIDVQKGNFSSWYYNKQLQDNFEKAENEKLRHEIGRLEKAARQTSNWSDKVEKTKYGDDSYDKGHIGHMAAKMMKRSKVIDTRRQTAVEEKSKLLKNLETVDELQIRPLTFHSDKLVSIQDLSIYYGDKAVGRYQNLDIRQGDRLALQGRNGSGKSSLIKLILEGTEKPEAGVNLQKNDAGEAAAWQQGRGIAENIRFQGDLWRANNLVISYVPQDTSFLHGTLTDYAEELGIEETLFKSVLRKLDFSRVQFEKEMQDFSGGQKKKVLLAGSLCTPAHLYLWDEPLNFIDVFSRMQIEELLKGCNLTILFVEHDRTFIEDIATEIINLP